MLLSNILCKHQNRIEFVVKYANAQSTDEQRTLRSQTIYPQVIFVSRKAINYLSHVTVVIILVVYLYK